MYETDFNWEGFKIQLGQFSTMVDSNEVSIGKVIQIFSDFGKNNGQKLLIPEVLNLVKQLLVMPTTNATK